MSDKALAKSLLEKREGEMSVLSGLKSIRGRLIFRAALLAILYLLFVQSGDGIFFYLGLGYVLGMTIQDISWFASISKTWPFTIKVTDWQKVEKIASKNS